MTRKFPFWRGAADPFLVGLIGIATCALQSYIWGKPIPSVHDEFSYLLAADTYRHGRWANPTPPLWWMFETIHELMKPTYASKYPPGQGLFLAAGWILGGHPAVGVWLGIGLACGATTWMLRAYVPRWWAVLGGLLMASRLGLGEWGWCYMGGGVAAAGGALFIGGWSRVLQRPRPLPATIMASGLVLLAISRPFEGLVLCVPVAVATFVRLVRARLSVALLARTAILPAAAVLIPSGVLLGYYNYRVTEHVFRLPYVEHALQYDVAPPLLIQNQFPTPKYRHRTIGQLHVEFELGDYLSGQIREFWLERLGRRLVGFWRMFIGYGLSIAILGLPYALLKSRRTRFALMAGLVVFGVVATLETWGPPHYTAPAVPLLYLLIVQGFRGLTLSTASLWPTAQWLSRIWLAGCLLAPAGSLAYPIHTKVFAFADAQMPAWMARELKKWLVHKVPPAWAVSREKIIDDLRRKGGKHLVFVAYEPEHSCHEEWVYNEADLPNAAILWARDMGPEWNARLIEAYPNREPLQLRVDRPKVGSPSTAGGAEPRTSKNGGQ
jgi:hypothetical protein